MKYGMDDRRLIGQVTGGWTQDRQGRLLASKPRGEDSQEEVLD